MVSILDDGAIKVWLGRLGSSGPGSLRIFRRFYDEVLRKEFPGLNPGGLVDWQVRSVGHDRYRILSLAQEWVNSQALRYKTKQYKLSCIRSFFMHNRADLPSDGSFRFKSDVPRVEGQLDVEKFKAVLHNSNRMYRAVFLMMAQAFLGESELVYVNTHCWQEVLEAVTKNVGFFKLTLPGRKQNRNVKNYYAVLSSKSDWANAFRDYMKVSSRPILGALFFNQRRQPLEAKNIQFYFHWRAVEAGAIQQFTPPCSHCHGETVRVRRKRGAAQKIAYQCKECGSLTWACDLKDQFKNVRYGVNPHEIRDLMRSRWQVSGADPVVAEFLMQHEIDPNQYNKFMKYEPWYPVQEYRKALPWLNVLSQEPNKIDRGAMDAELESYRVEIAKLREEAQAFRDITELLRDPDKMKKFKQLLAQ